MIEKWININGYNGDYKISNLGRVMSYKANKSGKLMKLSISDTGYYKVNLRLDGKVINNTIHNLVWDHFGKGTRNGFVLVVGHIDGNKLNNRIDNLQLLTHRDSITKGYKNKGLKFTGVSKNGKGFKAQIHFNGKSRYLGTYKTIEEAFKVYNETKFNCSI